MSSIKFSQLQFLTSPPSDTIFPIVSSGSNYKLALSSIKTAVTPSWSEVTGKPNFNSVAFSGLYADLSGKPTIPVIPTLVSAFTNDRGYLTTVDYGIITNAPQLSAVATSGNWLDIVNKPAWFNTTTPGYLYSDGSGTLSFQNVIDTSGGVSTATVKALIANSLTNFVSGVGTATVTTLIANSLSNFVSTVTSLIANSLTNYATQSYVTTRGYVTTASVNTLIANSLTNNLATVARTGNWTDVVNKPAWFMTTATGYLYSDGSGTLSFQPVQAGGTPFQLTSSTAVVTLTSDGTLTLPTGGVITGPVGLPVTLKAPQGNQAVLENNAGYNLILAQDQDVRVTTSPDAGSTFYTWNFGTDGSLTLPSGAGFVKGDNAQLKTNDGSTLSLDFRDSSGRGFYTNNDGYTLRSNGSYSWIYGADGTLNLPLAVNGKGVIQTTGDYYFNANGSIYNLGADGVLTIPGSITAVNGQSVVMIAPSGTAAIVSNHSGGNQLFVQDDGAYVQTSEVVTTNHTIGSNGSQFYTDIDIGGGFGVIDGWHQRNPQQIEVNIFTAEAPIWSVLIGASLGATVIVTYSTPSGNQTFTSVLSQQFTGAGQYDPGHNHGQRYSGRIDGTLPVGQTGIVSINFPTDTTNYKTWTFGTDGNLTFPNNTTQTTAWTGSVSSLVNGGSHSVVNDGSGALVLNDVQYIYPSTAGKDIDIYTNSAGSSELWLHDDGPAEIITNGGDHIWSFGKDGRLTLPAGGVIAEGGGLTGAIRLTPAGGANAYQALLIYPTAAGDGDHIHLTSGGGTTDLYLGDDDQYVKIEKNTGNVVIGTTNFYGSPSNIISTWTFGVDGSFTAPGLIYGGSNTIGLAAPAPLNLNNTGPIGQVKTQLNLINTAGNAGTGSAIDYFTYVDAGNGLPGARLQAVDDNAYSANFSIALKGKGNTGNNGLTTVWTFGSDGDLTLPGQLLFPEGTTFYNNGISISNGTQYATGVEGNTAAINQYWFADGTMPTRKWAAVRVNSPEDASTGSVVLSTGAFNSRNNWIFAHDGSTVLPENTLKGYCFTTTNTVFNYLPQAAQFLYTDNPILRSIATIGGAWYIKGPGLVGWKQITGVQDNGGVALIVRIGSGNTPLGDGSEFNSGGHNPTSPDLVYTISQYLELDIKAADKTWKFKQDGSVTFPDATVQTTAWTGTTVSSIISANTSTAYNDYFDAVATWDNLQARVHGSGNNGICQVKAKTTSINSFFSSNGMLTSQNGSGFTSVNNGTTLSTSTWTDVGVTIFSGGDTCITVFQDQDAGRIYRITFVKTLRNPSGATIAIERLT